MKWTKNQQQVIDARDCNLLVSAAAGSGKTAVLVERIIQMISDKENPLNIDELLVVTYTKAAAAQMRDKISKAIENMLIEEPENSHYLEQMNYIQKANILTIDSFCYQVVKEHFSILGIDPAIRIGEAGEIGLLKEEVLEEVMEDFYKTNPNFVEFSDSFSADKNDTNIEEYISNIYKLCSSYPRPEEWIKSAKKVLSIKSEEEFLDLTFVQEFFDEVHSLATGIRERILNALERIREIDGPLYMEKALLSDIQLVDDLISARTYTQVYDLTTRKFANIGRGKKGEYDEEKADYVKENRNEWKKQIQSLFDNFTIPFSIVLEQFTSQEARLNALLDITEAFRIKFLEEKIEKNMLEFSDVEHFALQIVCDGYEAGNPIPSVIGREMSENFREILIDEYQDSNYLQEAILKCVSRIPKGENNIFMVGDVKQSIYSFRMARPDLFMEKYDTYSCETGTSCRKILLKNNFRSRANVLESINYLFYQIMKRDLGGIDYTDAEALVPGREFPQISNDDVELLIGESKDFQFLDNESGEEVSVKDENLDENLEDIGKMELEATMVANKISSLLGRNGEKPFQVTDDQTGELRDVTYRDIVLLFRAPRSFQQIFIEVLTGYGIPVKAQNETGYLDTVEIRMLLSLLKVLDNPYNDVEVVAILRSYFCRFSSDELSLLALAKRGMQKNKKGKLYIYSVLKAMANLDNQEVDTEDLELVLKTELVDHQSYIREYICEKCKKLFQLLDALQEMLSYKSIDQILSEIYYKRGYYYYVEVMPDGKQRARNLDLFLQETKKFKDGPFQSVFAFLNFVDKLQKKAIELGGDPSPESSENVVRLMSIHRSKGLEFPIVFLSGMGKDFNLKDTKSPLIVHSDYYLAAKYRDPKKRCGNETFTRKAFSALMLTQTIAEELRIFYVGLTRTKEKLIMTGVTKDIPALVKKYQMIAESKDIKLSYNVIHSFRNYLDMVTAAFIRNASFYEAMKRVRKRFDRKEENIVSAEYKEPIYLINPEIRLQVEVYDFKSLAIQHIQSSVEKALDKREILEKLKHAPASYIEQIQNNIDWKYAENDLVEQKSKMAVTEIKRIYETEEEIGEKLVKQDYEKSQYVAPIPYFIAKEKKMNAAERGMWIHKMMELLDFTKISTVEDVKNALNCMWKEERLPEETKAFIKPEKIVAFLQSNLGKRMCVAAKLGKLYKEKQFIVGVPAEKMLKKEKVYESNSSILVQGIIDAYFKEEDHLILLDYKTDYIKQGEEKVLIDRYQTQLLYYKETLEQLTGLSVAETYIYSFGLDKEIRMF